MRLNLRPARRNLPASGSSRSATVTSGQRGPWPGDGGRLRDSVVMGVVTVIVTVVEPAPDAIDAGENVAAPPVGRPEAAKVIAAGKVVAGDTGLTVKENVADVPGSMVLDDEPLVAIEKSSTTSFSVVVVCEAWLLVSPGYFTVIAFVPIGSVVVVSLATAEAPVPDALNVPVPSEVDPS